MEAALLKAIKTLLLGMGDTAETQAILQQFEKTAKFDEFPSETTAARMRELYQLVQSKSK
jgi:phosphonate transport system substrate-binding protein